MDYNQLAFFLRIAEFDSFTDAANSLRTQRSSVSRRIAAFEEVLGIQLFYRMTRKVRLTPAGDWLRKQAGPLLADVERIVDTIPERASAPSGSLKVGIATDIAMVLAPFLNMFRDEYPDITVTLEVNRERGGVGLGDSDVEVALPAALGSLPDSDMLARQLLTFGSGIFASPDFLSEHPILTERDLQALPMVMAREMPRGSSLQVGVPSLFVDDPIVMLSCIQAGLGAGWLPLCLAQDAVAAGRLARVLPDVELTGLNLFVVYPPALRAVPRVRVFVDSLIRYFESSMTDIAL